MRIMIDLFCPACDTYRIDALVDREHMPACDQCGGQTTRAWLSAPSVHADEIPGGVLIHHGLCNADGSPRRYYSKTEIAAEAKRRGKVNFVQHLPDNKDTDKSATTQRFV